MHFFQCEISYVSQQCCVECRGGGSSFAESTDRGVSRNIMHGVVGNLPPEYVSIPVLKSVTLPMVKDGQCILPVTRSQASLPGEWFHRRGR